VKGGRPDGFAVTRPRPCTNPTSYEQSSRQDGFRFGNVRIMRPAEGDGNGVGIG